jgi:hypothetical protein
MCLGSPRKASTLWLWFDALKRLWGEHGSKEFKSPSGVNVELIYCQNILLL